MFTGWKIYEKKNGNGSYAKYDNQMVVIVSKGKKHKFLYIPAKVYAALGKPVRIMVLTRGSNIALCGTQETSGYAVQRNDDGAMAHIQISSFIRDNNLRSGAYTVHMENSMAVFDSADTPSQL